MDDTEVKRLSDRLVAHWEACDDDADLLDTMDDWADLLEDAKNVIAEHRRAAVGMSVERILADVILSLAEEQDEATSLGRSVGLVIRAAVEGDQPSLPWPHWTEEEGASAD